MRSYRIPDALVIPGFLSLLLAMLLTRREAVLASILAAAFLFILFYAVRRFTRGLGLGDAKLAAFAALYCGPCLAFLAFLIASAAGLVVVAVVVLRTGDRRRPIPFGPFIVLGAAAARLVGICLAWD